MYKSVMMRCLYSVAAVALTTITAIPVQAQTGAVAGTITTVDTGQPAAGANVEVIAASGETAGQTIADTNGRYRVEGLEPGTYSLIVTLIGHEEVRVADVRVRAGEVTRRAIVLTPRVVLLNPVTVTASRRQEKRLDAPATVTVIDRGEISSKPAITVTDHLSGVPGVDIADAGLLSSNIVSRGFNNVFSGALLVLTDNRIASVPSLRVNASYLIPVANQDIERIEVVLGPGAALYGPNSANGVLHIITRSPFESEGTSAGITFGHRAESNALRNIASMNSPGSDQTMFMGSFRHASALNDEWAFKISAQYMQGGDWRYFDVKEDSLRFNRIESARDSLEDAGLTGAALDRAVSSIADTLHIGLRDFTAERFAGELRVDWRPNNDTEVIFSAGSSLLVHGIELTQIGAAQGDHWRYDYYQIRYRRDNLFAQAFLNTSNAGDTYLLRTGDPIVDRSRMFVSQIQHSYNWGGRQVFTYGLDFQFTEPRTDGSITGRNEQDDEILITGGYLHSETALTPQLDLVAAARLDYHNRLPDLALSPRAALVYKPFETHSFRLTYNHAFSTPTTNNLFLDIDVQPLGPLPYMIRAVGVPEEGFSFRRDCAGGIGSLCMRSPFAPDPSAFFPATAAPFWNALVQVARAGILAETGVDIATIAPPNPNQVGSVLKVLDTNTGTFSLPISPSAVRDIDRLTAPTVQTFEVGYKGILSDQLLLTADAYYEQRQNFIGPLIVESPNVFFDRTELQAYLATQGISARNADIIGANLGRIPVGTVTPDHPLTSGPDLLVTYRNFGEVSLWGGDIALQLLLGGHYSVQGSYSYISEDLFPSEEVGGVADIAVNAPQHNGSLTVGYSDARSGLSAEVSGSYVGGFPVNSGVFMGSIEAYTEFNANVSYRLPFAPKATVTLSARNLLNNMHREFVGAPEIGRLVMTRLRYTF